MIGWCPGFESKARIRNENEKSVRFLKYSDFKTLEGFLSKVKVNCCFVCLTTDVESLTCCQNFTEVARTRLRFQAYAVLGEVQRTHSFNRIGKRQTNSFPGIREIDKIVFCRSSASFGQGEP